MKIRIMGMTALCLFGTAVVARAQDLNTDDAALIRHVRDTDPVLASQLGKCTQDQLVRHGKRFVYTAQCDIKPAPETECTRYAVTANGTVDNAGNATVRDLRLVLQCREASLPG